MSQLWKRLWTNDDGVYISGPSASIPKWMTVESDVVMKYPRLAFSTFILCTIVFFIGLVVSVQMLGNGDFISGIILLIITLVAGQGTRITFP